MLKKDQTVETLIKVCWLFDKLKEHGGTFVKTLKICHPHLGLTGSYPSSLDGDSDGHGQGRRGFNQLWGRDHAGSGAYRFSWLLDEGVTNSVINNRKLSNYIYTVKA